MICEMCWKMLRGQSGRVWKGTYDLNFNHHTQMKDLHHSANTHCGICRVLFAEIQKRLGFAENRRISQPPKQLSQPAGQFYRILLLLQSYWLVAQLTYYFKSNFVFRSFGQRHDIENAQSGTSNEAGNDIVIMHGAAIDTLPVSITASLRVSPRSVTYSTKQRGELYYLSFKVRSGHVRCSRIFALRPTADVHNPPFRTPISLTTSSDEVFQLSQQWMQRCTCVTADVKIPDWYPARLVDLGNLKLSSHRQKHDLENKEIGWEKHRKIRVVDTSGWLNRGNQGPNVRYVTLSHCWGQNPLTEHQLDSGTISKYMGTGVDLGDLPRTFRDAIRFAARLPRVGYIWIDSLCIIQRDEQDWLNQSATMEKVYSNTFLNISATHSDNMEGGLFRNRDPGSLLEDEVVLNIAGLPGVDQGSFEEEHHPSSLLNSDSRLRLPKLRRCTILDVSFWKDRVDHAPVNMRGWVLQERLMAPRVLHFCEDQVAWECREFDAAEGLPQDLPILQLAGNGVVEKSRLRGFDDIGAHNGHELGRQLRLARLAESQDPDVHLQPVIYAFELWARIVEVYSMTAITKPKDKLIALSGIARGISQAIGKSPHFEHAPRYIAGLWTLYMESQLLWFVEPDFQETNSSFRDRSTAPTKHEYRAPSFSWAAVDAQEMRGVKYGEVTDQDLFIELVDVSVTSQPGSDIYGLLEDAHLIVRGKLRRAVVQGPNAKGRFSWNLMGCGDVLDDEDHRNVYLDCPKRDGLITGPDANVFVLPVARGGRTATHGSKYMICLLLQLVLEGEKGRRRAFKRIGLTKLSPWADSKALEEVTDSQGRKMAKILVPHAHDQDMPHLDGYDASEGTHKILLV